MSLLITKDYVMRLQLLLLLKLMVIYYCSISSPSWLISCALTILQAPLEIRANKFRFVDHYTETVIPTYSCPVSVYLES